MADEHPRSHTAIHVLVRQCAEYVRLRNPHLRMLALSGSLTRADHHGDHSDADFFVVTQKDRIWEAFFGCLLQAWRFARRHGLHRTFFCFNYLVDEAYPEEIDLSRAEYVREFLRLDVLVGHDVYAELLQRFRDRLQAAEPELYEQARKRVLCPEDGPDQPAPRHLAPAGPPRSWWPAVYRALHLPFWGAAKWMETRRKSRYPGGFIYSNSRVIRSHLRRFWEEEAMQVEGMPAARAFTTVAPTYDDTVVQSPANAHMRSMVHAVLEELIRPGMQILDLGAGTGVDAVWMARRGASVLAVDAASGMVEVASAKVREAGLQERVQVRRLAAQELASLLPEHARRYDLVLANFGVLNLSGEPERWSPVVARLLKPGGRLVANVMNRVSVWELIAGLLRGRLSFALRRLRHTPARVGGLALAAELYTPGQFVARIARHFTTRSLHGLCTFAPPPALESLRRVWPGLWSLLCSLDRRLGRLPVIRAAGDHFLAVMQQDARPLLLRDGCGRVSAAPVVADVNGDGCPEVVVASDRLYILDRLGRHLGGWPRRVGGPLAGAPRVRPDPDAAVIYVGSDDGHLYALSADGTPLPGFPVPTGGPVSSAPLLVDPVDGGRPQIIFGSGDGGVYGVDDRGHTLPGWPLRTSGAVTASPVSAGIAGTTALVIGSGDGSLYVTDLSGSALPGWPKPLGSPIRSSAAVADLDGDGRAEIVVATNQLFAFRADGSGVAGFPVRLGAEAVGSPAVADLDGDGRPEVVVSADSLYAFRADGSPLPGFPVNVGAPVWATPILLDVDGDGHPEIVAGDCLGRLWAVSRTGQVLPGFPVSVGSRVTAAATAADLDGDGYLELIVASADGRVMAIPTGCPDRRGPVRQR